MRSAKYNRYHMPDNALHVQVESLSERPGDMCGFANQHVNSKRSFVIASGPRIMPLVSVQIVRFVNRDFPGWVADGRCRVIRDKVPRFTVETPRRPKHILAATRNRWRQQQT